jgi:DNA (cytosine-5)-methyltransferase 1
LDGITFPKWRNESIKAAGNAIVPQIAYRIFDTINYFQNGNG